ncbi:MAG: MaoC family dehydratase N-terminal domain-containing protein [Chloroflexi bacterium]|nr:MaoC family dehydratase N-terminal domain-containing protein [Chloroflexota bacterium]
MADAPLLTEELRHSILSRQSKPLSALVERGAVRRFAEAIGDPNPLWSDEAKARSSPCGGQVAPPTFLRSLGSELGAVMADLPGTRLLDAGSEWEYVAPIKAGDTITAVSRVADLAQRALRVGPALFVVTETTYTNQFGEVVARQRATLIRY